MPTRFASLTPAGAGFQPTAIWFMDWRMDGAAIAPQPAAASRELVPLLSAVAAGDRSALSALYQRTSPKLYGICVRLLSSDADAQDVLQDIYVTVWRKAALYDESKASPITWLAVLARNKAIDRLRGRRVGVEPVEAADQIADETPSAFDIVEQDRERDRLTNCLGELEPGRAAMVRAAFLDGRTYSELAELEGVPLGTMKSWIRRALLRLRGCLER